MELRYLNFGPSTNGWLERTVCNVLVGLGGRMICRSFNCRSLMLLDVATCKQNSNSAAKILYYCPMRACNTVIILYTLRIISSFSKI